MNWLRNWWWARQRAMDLRILWPSCKELAPNLDKAKQAFMMHAINDPAWVRHYGEKLWEAVNALT
jgi:hypothetical protein